MHLLIESCIMKVIGEWGSPTHSIFIKGGIHVKNRKKSLGLFARHCKRNGIEIVDIEFVKEGSTRILAII